MRHRPRPVLAALLALGLTLAGGVAAHALDPVNATWRGLAIDGYDPVAYFTDHRPVEGSADFTFEWQGATWRFASAAHRDLFARDPQRWAPQYGGYCAWAVAHDKTADIDPAAWAVVGDRLFLNYDLDVQKKWLAARDESIRSADANWPHLLAGN